MDTPAATWNPTHRVDTRGASCWEDPYAPAPLAARLDPGLDVRVIERWGDWAKVVCSNGWTTWVDVSQLVPIAAPHPTWAAPPPAAGQPAVAAPPTAKRPVSGGRLAVVGVTLAALIAAIAIPVSLAHRSGSPSTAGGTGASSSASLAGFPDPATLEHQLTSAFATPAPVSASQLTPLFAKAAQQVTPHLLYAPTQPRAPSRLAPIGPPSAASLSDYVDSRVQGDVPQDFVSYVSDGVLLGLKRWDDLYADSTFNFETAAAAQHIRLLITTDRTPFAALVHTTVFRYGYLQPCANAPVTDRKQCIPEVRVYFDPSRWKSGDYEPMTKTRIAHEVIHAGHVRLLASLGKADLFQVPGYYWQTEAFATVTQRLLPDPPVYTAYGIGGLLNESFFAWPSLSDTSYELSYTASPFVDEVVFQSGDDPKLMLHWLQGTRAGEPSSLSFMRTVSGTADGNVDLNGFQRLYALSLMDLRFPGFLTSKVDPRTVDLPSYDNHSDGRVDAGALPLRVSAPVPVIGNRMFQVSVQSLPDDDNTTMSVTLSGAPNTQAIGVVFALKGDDQANLDFCYNQITDTDTAKRVSAARACLSQFARAFGVIAPGDSATVSAGALRKFSPDLSKLHIATLVFGLATPSVVTTGTPPAPINVTMTVDKQAGPTPTPPPGDNMAGQLNLDASYVIDSVDTGEFGLPLGAPNTSVNEELHLVVHLRMHRSGPREMLFVDDGSTWELSGSGSGFTMSCIGDVHNIAYRFTYSGKGTLALNPRSLIPLDTAHEGMGGIQLTLLGEENQLRDPQFAVIGHRHIDYSESTTNVCSPVPADGQRRVGWSTSSVSITRSPDGTCKLTQTELSTPGVRKTQGSLTLKGTFSCPAA